jgi:glycosyltransferase involved in cell wall biosynthesis
MSEANPLSNNISIIIAVYNGAKTLQACLNSVLSQTYPYMELIVMDGGSLDGTVEILRNISHRLSFWDSQKDRGIAHAWNKAMNHATGNWVLFLGSDDRLLDEHVLADMAQILRDDVTNDVIFGKCLMEGGEFHGEIWGGRDITAIRRRMTIPHIATFHRRTFMEEVGSFDETFKIAMDYELLIRKKVLSARFVDRLVTVMGGGGVSSVMIKNGLLELRKAQIKNQADWRVKIEAWHAAYQFRQIFNQLRK